jgi:hypothetical protein
MNLARSLLIGSVVGLGVSIVFTALRCQAQRGPAASELRYGSGMRALAVTMLFVVGFIAYAALHAREDQRWIAWPLACVFVLGAAWLLLEAFFTRVRFDEHHLYAFSPWRPARVIPYAAVTGFRYAETWQWHELATTRYGTLRLSIYLVGIEQFGEFLDRRLAVAR